jgi:hypothetical protein
MGISKNDDVDMCDNNKTFFLPEETKSQIRDKVNCFAAEDLYWRRKMKEIEHKRFLIHQHHEGLMMKLRNVILAEARRKSRV